MTEPHVYTLAEIPAEVHAELENYFKTVTTDKYGTFDSNTRSFKSSYVSPADNSVHTTITVRGNVDADAGELSLRQVSQLTAVKAGE